MEFSATFVTYRIDNKYGIVDFNGNVILKPIPYKIKNYNSDTNLVLIQQNDKYGFIDTNGNLVIKPIYDEITKNFNNFKEVKLNNDIGIIDNNGNIIGLIW